MFPDSIIVSNTRSVPGGKVKLGKVVDSDGKVEFGVVVDVMPVVEEVVSLDELHPVWSNVARSTNNNPIVIGTFSEMFLMTFS